MAKSIESVYMVEASKELRETQRNLLCGKEAQTTQSKIGVQGASKYDGKPIVWAESLKSIPYGTCNILHPANYPLVPHSSWQTQRLTAPQSQTRSLL